MAKSKKEPETYSKKETVARREAALKRAFAMPHKPHRETKSSGPLKRERPEDRD